jgi:hypothetical protein
MHKLYSDYVHPQRHLVVLPDHFDQWFIVNHFILDAPGTIHQAGDVPSDKVICTLQLNKSTVQLYCKSTGPFPDFSAQQIDHANYIFAYSLMLYVEIPESSGLDLAHSFSPVATIARYEGDSADINAPMWTCIPPQRIFEFYQRRHNIAEIFFKLAVSADNYTASVSILLF